MNIQQGKTDSDVLQRLKKSAIEYEKKRYDDNTNIDKLNHTLESLKKKLIIAEANFELQLAADLKHGAIPKVEKRIAKLQNKLYYYVLIYKNRKTAEIIKRSFIKSTDCSLYKNIFYNMFGDIYSNFVDFHEEHELFTQHANSFDVDRDTVLSYIKTKDSNVIDPLISKYMDSIHNLTNDCDEGYNLFIDFYESP